MEVSHPCGWAEGKNTGVQSNEGNGVMQVGQGTVVSFDYVLRDDEGEILDQSDSPMEYLHGYGNIIPGLEKALEGAEPKQHHSVIVEAADAYGEADPAAIISLPLTDLPEGMEVELGMNLVAETPGGPVHMKVREVTDDSVVLDANHPLAGQRLHFEVDVVEVRSASEDELKEGRVQD